MSESLVASHPTVGPLLTERAQRAKLLEAMVQVVAEKGYAAATVADAVRVAKVSRGTFYELFDSKQACLSEAYRLGVRAYVSAAKDALRPTRQVVAFKPFEQRKLDFGLCRNVLERDLPFFALLAQPCTKSHFHQITWFESRGTFERSEPLERSERPERILTQWGAAPHHLRRGSFNAARVTM